MSPTHSTVSAGGSAPRAGGANRAAATKSSAKEATFLAGTRRVCQEAEPNNSLEREKPVHRRAPRAGGGGSDPLLKASRVKPAEKGWGTTPAQLPAERSRKKGRRPRRQDPPATSARRTSGPQQQIESRLVRLVGQPRAGEKTGSRKVRTPKGRVVGKSDPGKPAGKCHRKQTA